MGCPCPSRQSGRLPGEVCSQLHFCRLQRSRRVLRHAAQVISGGGTVVRLTDPASNAALAADFPVFIAFVSAGNLSFGKLGVLAHFWGDYGLDLGRSVSGLAMLRFGLTLAAIEALVFGPVVALLQQQERFVNCSRPRRARSACAHRLLDRPAQSSRFR